jgi:hypothetical protein
VGKMKNASLYRIRARVAELADALDSGSSGLTALEVRVLSRAPIFLPFFASGCSGSRK